MSKKTLEQITRSGNNFLVKVKRNQIGLFREVIECTVRGRCVSSDSVQEKNRGRAEKRRTRVYRASKAIRDLWPGIRSIMSVERERTKSNSRVITVSYYVTSLKLNARKLAQGVRHHWGIENRLHYVKDVVFKEDTCKIKSGNAPGIFSLIRNLIINIIRSDGKQGVSRFLRCCNGNIALMMSYLE